MYKRKRTTSTFKPSKARRTSNWSAGAARASFVTSQLVRNRRLRATGGFLGLERKFLDSSKTLTTLPAPADCSGAELDPATTNQLNAVAQGDGESNRDGKNYVIKSIHFRGVIREPAQTNQVATDVISTYFVAIVQDTQTNAAQLNSEDVFTNPGASSSFATSPLRNLQYSKRFKVLKWWRGSLPVPSVTYDGTNVEQTGTEKLLQCDIPCNIRVNTKGTSANVTDIVDNSLHVIGFSSQATAQLGYNCRIRFMG